MSPDGRDPHGGGGDDVGGSAEGSPVHHEAALDLRVGRVVDITSTVDASRYRHVDIMVYVDFSGYLHVRVLEGDLPHTLQRLGVDSHRLKPAMNIRNKFKAEVSSLS